MVNHVILVGHLTRDAESLSGTRGPVTRLRLATSIHWRDTDGNRHEATESHNLVAFNRLAEICAQFCVKGRFIYVSGRLRTREYEGADGLRRTSTEVVIDTMRLLDRREHDGSTSLIPPPGASCSPIPAGSAAAAMPADNGTNAPPTEGHPALDPAPVGASA